MTLDELEALRLPPGAPDDDFDECKCGDARVDHLDKTGACRFRTHYIPQADLNTCQAFRLFGRAGWRKRIRDAEGRIPGELRDYGARLVHRLHSSDEGDAHGD